MIAHWETKARKKQAQYPIFTVESVSRRHPERASEADFVVIDSPDWVNIIPLTPEGMVIMVRQYRHGSDSITLEIPGGMVNPGEDPALAAARECSEETGFQSRQEPLLLGRNLPNPAFLNNSHSSYLWPGCTASGVQAFDEHEEIEVVQVPLAEIPARIQSGEINHSLVLTAFFYFSLHNSFENQ